MEFVVGAISLSCQLFHFRGAVCVYVGSAQLCTAVFFNPFAVMEPSVNVCVAHITLWNNKSVYIATMLQQYRNCCKFRPRQIRSVYTYVVPLLFPWPRNQGRI